MPTDYLALADTLMEWRAGSEPIYFDGEQTGQWEDVPKDFVTLQKEREEAASAIRELVAENKALTDALKAAGQEAERADPEPDFQLLNIVTIVSDALNDQKEKP